VTRRKQAQGFSLAEVLITLIILGIIAAFAIPSLFQTPNSTLANRQTTRASSIAFMILNAYERYRSENATVPTTMSATHLTPYMNYVSVDTSGANVDQHPTALSRACNGTTPCLNLHSGGKLLLWNEQFAGSSTTHCIQFLFDPDGAYSGSSADSSGKSVQFQLYYDGTIRSRGTAKTNSCNSITCGFGPNSALDPSWFTGF
jgi:prepilin-type N-terminal cleavage/methylation domain-containing protein